MENTKQENATTVVVATETVKTVVETAFDTLISELENGCRNDFMIAKPQRLKIVDSVDADGNLTGFVEVKKSGGNVAYGIAENLLLTKLQSLLANKGIAEFRNDAITFFGNVENDEYALSVILKAKGIETKKLFQIVSGYLKARAKRMLLTDLQVIRILQAVCRASKVVDAEKSVRRITQDERELFSNEMSAYNDAIRLERQTMAEKLKANSQTA